MGNQLGKMKGNRLNTAANVGSFVTGRQQLAQQRAIAANTAAAMQIQRDLLEIQKQQAYEADYDRLLNRTDRAVAEGRMTRGQADLTCWRPEPAGRSRRDVRIGNRPSTKCLWPALT